MKELEIADRVIILSKGITGTVVEAGPEGYNVEYRTLNGNVACELFSINELQSPDEQEIAVANAFAANSNIREDEIA